jgi:hypothetical protein
VKIPRTTIALCLFLTCCQTEHIANYPAMPAAQATRILLQRSQSIQTISAEGLVTLERPSGDTLRLDAAMVIQRPGSARLRAWKLGQAVFDITLTPAGLWVAAPRQDPSIFSDNTANLMRRWLRLITGAFEDQPLASDDNGASLVLKWSADDGATIICEVDRKTLVARRYILTDRLGRERFTLELARYAEFNGIVWPRRIEAKSPDGRIVIDLRDVQMNGELPSAAFRPPARAVRIPETQP